MTETGWEIELPGAEHLRQLRDLDAGAGARLPAAGAYDQPLDSRRLAAEQPYQRALLCAQLDTMWTGLQADIEYQRESSERGVDPRSQQLQLQIIKIKAQLWRMLAAPLPEPEPEPDPQQQLLDARTAAEGVLAQVQAKLAAGDQ